jgi:hypothetical protein
MKEHRYFSKAKLYKRGTALPKRMSLLPVILWLTINQALLFSVYHHFFSILHTSQDDFAYLLRFIGQPWRERVPQNEYRRSVQLTNLLNSFS